jgi:hypothetical protein
LLASGVTRTELESGEWTSPHFGYHRSAQVNDPIRQRLLDVVAVDPDHVVLGGWAAAYLQGVAYLDGGWGHPAGGGTGEPVLVLVPPGKVINRPGIRTLRTTLDPDDVVEEHGIRCTSATRTAYDVLRLADDLSEAVVAGDCLLHSGITTVAAISAYDVSHPGGRGTRRLRAALPLLDAGAASPPETRLRLLCKEAGLPPLLVNVPVFDRDGNFLGIVDLLEPFAGLGLEYDGAHHRELEQHTADNRREERLEANGLAIARVTSLDLADRRATISRIQDAHRRRLFRDSAAETWTCRPRSAAVPA